MSTTSDTTAQPATEDFSLLPCPMCGGEAFGPYQDHTNTVWTVACRSQARCGFYQRAIRSQTAQQAVERWNNRVVMPTVESTPPARGQATQERTDTLFDVDLALALGAIVDKAVPGCDHDIGMRLAQAVAEHQRDYHILHKQQLYGSLLRVLSTEDAAQLGYGLLGSAGRARLIAEATAEYEAALATAQQERDHVRKERDDYKNHFEACDRQRLEFLRERDEAQGMRRFWEIQAQASDKDVSRLMDGVDNSLSTIKAVADDRDTERTCKEFERQRANKAESALSITRTQLEQVQAAATALAIAIHVDHEHGICDWRVGDNEAVRLVSALQQLLSLSPAAGLGEDTEQWTSVNERRPAMHQRVLGLRSDGEMIVFWRVSDWELWYEHHADDSITHWQPLPEPPASTPPTEPTHAE